MSDIAGYEIDILLWSERQAEILRDLKTRTNWLPNDLDIENLAEEIETVGRSEFRAFESYVELIFRHLIEAVANPDPGLYGNWRSEIFSFQIEARRAVTPSMAARLESDTVWRHAIAKAKLDLEKYDDALPDVPQVCPIALDEVLIDEPLDVSALVERIRSAACPASGR